MTPPRKTLTITYYVDPRDLKSITISMRSARFFAGACVAVVVWSLGSLAYISTHYSTAHHAKMPLAIAKSPETPPTTTVSVAPPEAPLAEPEVRDSEIALLKLSAKNKLAAKAEPPPVALANTTFKQENGQLVMRFAVENKGNGQIAGHVWGFARFAPAESASKNDPVVLASHPLLDKAEPMAEGNLAYALTYKARMRSMKELRFALPEGTPGQVTDLTIYVREKSTPAPATFSVSGP